MDRMRLLLAGVGSYCSLLLMKREDRHQKRVLGEEGQFNAGLSDLDNTFVPEARFCLLAARLQQNWHEHKTTSIISRKSINFEQHYVY